MEQLDDIDLFAFWFDLDIRNRACAVARQTALAISGKIHGNIDMATWAESAAMGTVLNVTERLIPTGYLLDAG
ncbi:hypothetical protein E0J16_34030 [Rhizobium pisi]|nr:hypothetical protein E0J16_34030 [Rhizobium pisi]